MTLPPGPAWLFVPGTRPDRWAKAANRADTVIVDLENAVGAHDKASARHLVAGVTEVIGTDNLVVRLNGLDTPWFKDDAAMIRDSGVRTVMMPKVSGPEDIRRAADVLPQQGIVALCETASSIVDARDIGDEKTCVGLFWGGEDLSVDLGGTTSRDVTGAYYPFIEHVRTTTRLAARASNVAAIDAPTLLIDRHDLVTSEARLAFVMGYHAKACIHPEHVPLIRAASLPHPNDVAWATSIVEAAADFGPGTDVPVFALDGQMVDSPVVALAQRVLDSAQHRKEHP